ncbi:hypothetical protein ACSYDW_07070 [Paeniglutamicibacter sp. R2-26]|uniref:hypothetical protein n=1 Tax=Paeniglutamicibacter sp. R2-26 TaxID=3144417 RepID=UPI003EE5D14A
MAYMAKSQWLVTISGIHDTWDTQTGGNGSGTPIKHRRGGQQRQTIIGTPPEFEDITCTRLFGDGYLELMAKLNKQINISRHTITKQALDANGVRKGKPITYKNCLLTGVAYSDVDSNATSEVALMTLTFATEGPA